MLIFNVVSNVDLLCRFPMLFLMLIFGIDFLCWFSMSRFFRINFSYVFLLLNYNFALVDITPFFLYLFLVSDICFQIIFYLI